MCQSDLVQIDSLLAPWGRGDFDHFYWLILTCACAEVTWCMCVISHSLWCDGLGSPASTPWWTRDPTWRISAWISIQSCLRGMGQDGTGWDRDVFAEVAHMNKKKNSASHQVIFSKGTSHNDCCLMSHTSWNSSGLLTKVSEDGTLVHTTCIALSGPYTLVKKVAAKHSIHEVTHKHDIAPDYSLLLLWVTGSAPRRPWGRPVPSWCTAAMFCGCHNTCTGFLCTSTGMKLQPHSSELKM